MFRRDERVVCNDGHSKGAGSTGYDASYPAQANNTKGLTAQLNAEETLAFPAARLETAVRLRNSTGQCNQQSDCMLRRGNRISIGSVHYHNPMGCRGRHIDVVDSNPGTPDNSQMRRCVHQLRCNFCLTAHNQPTRIAYRFAQLVGWQPGALLEQESGVSERLKTTIANVIGNENLWFISRHEELETYLRVVRKEGGMVTVSKTCVESGIIARR